MTNKEFKDKFNSILEESSEDRINLLNNLIENASKDLSKNTILDKEDFYELGRRVLEEKLSDVVYKCENGTMLMINDRIDAYCYDNGWIDIGYLYNAVKGSMTTNLSNLSSCVDYYRNLKYLLEHSEIESVVLLK